ncbi:MAG: Holliday junction branch migration protein RuvA, partial [Alistipes sp.]|nr:Holliday junction branch migration protein RuvA [Alistipes sp.]
MYEYISGLVADLAPTYAVIDAGGVGYYVNISLQTYSAIEGEKSARLYVHFVVREDAQLLYGFATKLERELFRHLISVSGVGGNTARMILSTYSTAELRNIIATENAVLLKNVKGLGLKTAQKIIVE